MNKYTDINSNEWYHVTKKSNFNSIITAGLKSCCGENTKSIGDDRVGVSLCTSENISHWMFLLDSYTIFRVDISEIPVENIDDKLFDIGGELVITQDIPTKYISVYAEDAKAYFNAVDRHSEMRKFWSSEIGNIGHCLYHICNIFNGLASVCEHQDKGIDDAKNTLILAINTCKNATKLTSPEDLKWLMNEIIEYGDEGGYTPLEIYDVIEGYRGIYSPKYKGVRCYEQIKYFVNPETQELREQLSDLIEKAYGPCLQYGEYKGGYCP